MPDWQWQWVQLPCRDGGRGLLPLVEMAPLACASSWSLSWPWLMHGGGGEGDDALWPGLLEVAGVGQDGGIIPQRSEVMDELGGVWMGQVQGCAELGGVVGEELANLLEAPRKQRTLASPVLSQLSSMLLTYLLHLMSAAGRCCLRPGTSGPGVGRPFSQQPHLRTGAPSLHLSTGCYRV